MPVNSSRRQFLRQSAAGGIAALTFVVAGCEKELTPGDARKANAAFQVLSAEEIQTLERLADIFVPGSVERGVAHYLDHQLAVLPADCMLMIRYLGVNSPFATFYQSSVAATDAASQSIYGEVFSALDPAQANELAAQIASGSVPDWDGPPSGLFFFVIRSDAVDVRYGTERGFEELGIPYAAHIRPPSPWGS